MQNALRDILLKGLGNSVCFSCLIGLGQRCCRSYSEPELFGRSAPQLTTAGSGSCAAVMLTEDTLTIAVVYLDTFDSLNLRGGETWVHVENVRKARALLRTQTPEATVSLLLAV